MPLFNIEPSFDFLIFQKILDRGAYYSNSLTLEVAQKLQPFSFLNIISRLLLSKGITLYQQYIIFLTLQVFIAVLAIFIIASTLRRNLSETIACCILYFSSYFSKFGRYMSPEVITSSLVGSTLGLSTGLLSVAFFMRGDIPLAVFIASLNFFIHPSYAVIMLVIFFTYILDDFIFRKRMKRADLIYASFMAFIIMLLWAIYIMKISGFTFLKSKVTPLWWLLLSSRTSNPFPAQDGIFISGSLIVSFILSFWLAGKMNKYFSESIIHRIRWLIGSVILAWITQIFFAEYAHSALFTRLVLNRITPYAVLFVIMLYVSIIWSNQNLNFKWFFLLVPFLVGALNKLCANIIFKTNHLIYLIILCIYLFLIIYAIKIRIFSLTNNFYNTFGNFKNKFMYFNKRPWLILTFGVLLSLSQKGLYSLKNEKYNRELIQMHRFIREKTEPQAMVLSVPLKPRFSSLPTRASFLEWNEIMYTLYLPELTDEVSRRLMLMGIDLRKFNSDECVRECGGWRQYIYTQCRRQAFAEYAGTYNEQWRSNLLEMRKIAPNLTYVIIDKKNTKPLDRAIFQSGDLVLLKIDDLLKNNKKKD